MTDVIVVGAGVIGLLAALRLRQAGLSVEVFDKSEPAMESSWAALGVLSPEAAPGRTPQWLRLAQASLALFPSLADELRAQTGVDVALRREGLLHLALDEAEEHTLREDEVTQRTANVPVQWLSAAEARALEPNLTDQLRAALHFRHGWRVDNVRLNTALVAALDKAGVPIQTGRTVTQIVSEGGRVLGVRAGAEVYRAPWVVVAAGAWSGMIDGVSLPVRPAKGQALLLDAAGLPAFGLSHVIDSQLGYIVPRGNNKLLLGATVEDAAFDKRVSTTAIRELVSGAQRMVPALKDARVRETWAGLRPRSADDQPLLGPVRRCPGLVAATGHFRNGILLAPITALLVTDWLTEKPASVDVSAFSPDRFG